MCQGFPVEMIVRGYLCGSAWRAYKSGVREICGVRLPEGMRENEKFPHPIITPTTKAEMGLHDEDISKEESWRKVWLLLKNMPHWKIYISFVRTRHSDGC